MYDLYKEMLSLTGEKEYKPNVMVLYREKTVVPLPKQVFVNPLYGNADKARILDNELDERVYDRTILRHSAFFDRMRKIRMNVNASGPYILGDTSVADIPDYRTREIYCDGFLKFFKEDGTERKLLCIPGEGVFEFFGDNSVKIMLSNPVIPYVTLDEGKTTCTTVSPITDKITSFGKLGTRLNRFFSTENVSESISENGGTVTFSYSSFMYGMETEHIEISMKIFPINDIGSSENQC